MLPIDQTGYMKRPSGFSLNRGCQEGAWGIPPDKTYEGGWVGNKESIVDSVKQGYMRTE